MFWQIDDHALREFRDEPTLVEAPGQTQSTSE